MLAPCCRLNRRQPGRSFIFFALNLFLRNLVGIGLPVKSDITEKLNREVKQQVTSERQVVYILVEIRKLLEIEGQADVYPSLRFHCDWVVHTALHGPQAQQIVRVFDKNQQLIDHMSTEASKPKEEPPAPSMDFLGELQDIMRLDFFRADLARFLETLGIDSRLTDEDERWMSFLGNFVRVVQDCPLRCIGQGLKFTEEVVLRAVYLSEEFRKTHGFVLAIQWEWVSKTTGVRSASQQFFAAGTTR